jgi:hypothetical protein
MEKETGKLIMFIGALLTLAGARWFYFPFTTMLLASLVINLLIRLFRYIR